MYRFLNLGPAWHIIIGVTSGWTHTLCGQRCLADQGQDLRPPNTCPVCLERLRWP